MIIIGKKQKQLFPPICIQCEQPIIDPFILRLHPNLEFHIGCIKCLECGIILDERSGSAFLRNGKIFCRNDYNRLFIEQCQRCGMPCQPNEMVMRAKQLLFHINCFNCIICKRQLITGDQFILKQDELFCRPECFMINFQQKEMIYSNPIFPLQQQFINSNNTIIPSSLLNENIDKHLIFDNNFETKTNNKQINNNNCLNNNIFIRPQSTISSNNNSPISYSNPEEESLTPSSSTNASTPMPNNGGQQLFLGQQSSSSYHSSNNFDQSVISNNNAITAAAALFSVNRGTTSNCSSSSGSLIVRQKHNTIKRGRKEKPTQRVRTVLNETQLKLLKHYYNNNQRPDTGTKEKLVEQTGLNARVIRVWFQNKRCKDKKRQIEQREKQNTLEKEQALIGVRLNGVGPLTVCSPGPISLMEHQLNQRHEQFHNALEIHQVQQNPNIWEGGIVDEQQQKQHLIEASFSNSMAIMSSNPSTALPVSMPSMFLQQHAISE